MLTHLRTLLALALFSTLAHAAPPVAPGKRILFLGDSITYGASYITFIDAAMIFADPQTKYDVISAGLSSETVSGLSEPGHADGKFPRPCLHERLDRVLTKAKPDLVLACYGMNDGIYMPLSVERFQAFRDGMTKLHEKVIATGAKIIHLTPPVFDPVPIAQKVGDGSDAKHPYRGYNDVLDAYSEWLLAQRKNGWEIIDVHGSLKSALAVKRATEPTFTFSKDGVHPGDEGHQLMAQPVLDAWGIQGKAGDISAISNGAEVMKLIRSKTETLRDGWLTYTEHTRPGVKAGLPIEEATRKAAELDDTARKNVLSGKKN